MKFSMLWDLLTLHCCKIVCDALNADWFLLQLGLYRVNHAFVNIQRIYRRKNRSNSKIVIYKLANTGDFTFLKQFHLNDHRRLRHSCNQFSVYTRCFIYLHTKKKKCASVKLGLLSGKETLPLQEMNFFGNVWSDLKLVQHRVWLNSCTRLDLGNISDLI